MEATCGADGGRKRDGSPCTRPPGWGLPDDHPEAGRRCRDHIAAEEERRESIKAELLAEFTNRPDSDVKEAALAIGSSVTAIHRLRKLDPEFDAAVSEHIEGRMQEERNRNVATSLYRHLVNPLDRASAAHFALYLFNRDPDNWKDAKRIDLAGHDGGPLAREVESAREALESRLNTLASRVGAEGVSPES